MHPRPPGPADSNNGRAGAGRVLSFPFPPGEGEKEDGPPTDRPLGSFLYTFNSSVQSYSNLPKSCIHVYKYRCKISPPPSFGSW